MRVKATSTDKKTSLRQAVGRVELRADTPDEAAFLAKLVRVIVDGGVVSASRMIGAYHDHVEMAFPASATTTIVENQQ